ncbi:MAG: hypothetical protein RSC10_00160 [Longicatena sp.]
MNNKQPINFNEYNDFLDPDCEYLEMIHECVESDACEDESLVASIASVERAIAHILNAEGEKLQKVIACSNDICDLLAVNESVNKVIKSMTLLEHILYNKLDLATTCFPCEEDCDSEIECD